VTTINLFRNDGHPLVVPVGAAVFRDGDAGDTMYGVISGEVAIIKHGILLERIGPGGIIGEMALVDHGPRSADVVAQQETRLAVIDRPRFEHLVTSHPTFALQVMAVMAERLRRADDERTRAAGA
jgi:CRP/FNR family transcriptional regulator, cyclic AMP receptor protein